MNSSHDHLTAEQVFEVLQKDYPEVSRATVYNNLKKMCEAKMIKRVSFEEHLDRYDRIEKHDHLVCQRCGRLSDVHFEDLTKALEKQHEERYRALLHSVEMAEVFARSEFKVWECRNCGHIVVGTKAPEICPTCKYPKSFFEIHCENY